MWRNLCPRNSSSIFTINSPLARWMSAERKSHRASTAQKTPTARNPLCCRQTEYKGMWEFPSGKLEAGETPQQAIVREIKEELDVKISVGELIQTIEYDYPDFHLSMDCFWAEISVGQLVIKEALEAKWLSKDKLFEVDWLPADLLIVPEIEKAMVTNGYI